MSRDAWEKRASLLEGRLASVLFKGLSECANEALHKWHVAVVQDAFLARLRTGARILDLGCGYGRMAPALEQGDTSRTIVGQDFSLRYCQLFKEGTALPIVQANLIKLPFQANTFDGCIAVTSLMYLETEELRVALDEIARILSPGGYCLLIDPGKELKSILAKLTLRDAGPETGGRGFSKADYRAIVSSAGFELADAGGNLRDTIKILLSLGGHWGWKLWSMLVRKNSVQGGYARFALHRWILARAPGEPRGVP